MTAHRPTPTPRVLDALRAGGVKATFFVLGRHTEQHPDLVAQMRAEGHEVASHGYDHRLLPFASRDEVRTQLALTEDAVLVATGAPPERLFRAPHGFRGPAVGRITLEQGYRVVGWTKGVWDTARPGAEVIAERAERGFRPGAILLLHDADGSGQGADRTQTAEALPRILSSADAAGYRFLTISEMAGHAHPRRVTAWRAALVAALCAVVLEITLRRVDTSALQAVDIAWWWVAASLAANLLSIITKATVWKCCLDAVPDHRSVRYAQVVPALFVGFLLNTLLVARLGDLARIGVLARRLKIEGQPMRATTIAGTVVTEQVVIGVALAATLLAMAAALPVPKWARDLVLVFVMVIVVLGLALVGLELLPARGEHERADARRPPIRRRHGGATRCAPSRRSCTASSPASSCTGAHAWPASRSSPASRRGPRRSQGFSGRSRPSGSTRGSGRPRSCSSRRRSCSCSRSCPATWASSRSR